MGCSSERFASEYDTPQIIRHSLSQCFTRHVDVPDCGRNPRERYHGGDRGEGGELLRCTVTLYQQSLVVFEKNTLRTKNLRNGRIIRQSEIRA